jgi:hypothetical protein
MVKAIIAGAKTQTRRIVKLDAQALSVIAEVGADDLWRWRDGAYGYGGLCASYNAGTVSIPLRCPYGIVGDRLWVKETYQPLWSSERCPSSMSSPDGWAISYVATSGVVEYRDDERGLTTRCRPAIFMPRWASRIELEVTGVRVERLQAISEVDARAEGVSSGTIPADDYGPQRIGFVLGRDDGKSVLYPTERRAFEVGWDAINGERASWASNPWVWVVEFKRVDAARSAA